MTYAACPEQYHWWVPMHAVNRLRLRARTLSGAVLCLFVTAGCGQESISPGILAVSPDRLTDSAVVLSTAHRALTIHTENLGAGLLYWVATVKHASPWLTIQPTTGMAGVDSAVVWADPTGLAAGVYRDTVVVSADAGGTAQVPIAFFIMPNVATQLRFTTQPSNAAADGGIVPVQVIALDARGYVVSTFARGITVSIVPDTGGASVGGTTTVAAVAGVATFSNLGIHTAGCYRLIARAADLQPDTSSTFCITPGPPIALSFKEPPTVSTFSCRVGLAVATLRVTVVDAYDNTVVSDTRLVQVALGSNPGGSTLSGTTTVAAVAGVATFSDLKIDGTATGYTLVAAATALTGATSAPFGVPPDACWDHLTFMVPPSNAVAGTVIVPPVQVCAIDGFGNVDTTFTGVVTMALGSNPGGGTLSGTLSKAAVRGCASFSDLSIDKAGAGYALSAFTTGITGAMSSAFNIAP
jgi:hypothetical protein